MRRRGIAGVGLRRLLGGLAGLTVLVLPQAVMPHPWVAASHLEPLGLWRLAVNALVSVFFLPVLRLVSYRRRDILVLALVPFWQLAVAWTVGYRAAYLPLRDWAPRPDERLRVHRIRGGQHWVLAR
jgi:hypothetical protein